MPILTKRRKWIGIAVATLLAVVGIAYLLGFPPFAPTAQQARAALAEAGWCKPDEPIVKRDGNLFIGSYKCDLANRHFYYGRKWPGHFMREHGRWIACPRANEPLKICNAYNPARAGLYALNSRSPDT